MSALACTAYPTSPRQWPSVTLNIPPPPSRKEGFFFATKAKSSVIQEATRRSDVADAGHMVAGDKNDIFTDAVMEFLGRTFTEHAAD